MALSEVYVSVPMPEALAHRLRVTAERDCSSLAATARRLLAYALTRESARGDRDLNRDSRRSTNEHGSQD